MAPSHSPSHTYQKIFFENQKMKGGGGWVINTTARNNSLDFAALSGSENYVNLQMASF